MCNWYIRRVQNDNISDPDNGDNTVPSSYIWDSGKFSFNACFYLIDRCRFFAIKVIFYVSSSVKKTTICFMSAERGGLWIVPSDSNGSLIRIIVRQVRRSVWMFFPQIVVNLSDVLALTKKKKKNRLIFSFQSFLSFQLLYMWENGSTSIAIKEVSILQ